MRMNRRDLFVGVLISTMCCPSAFAERPPQAREKAAFALVGTVTSVEETWSPMRSDYRVFVRVEAVERGLGIEVGDTFKATCFQAIVPPGFGGASGHRMVPNPGDRLRFYANGRDLEGAGTYPDWCDILEPSWTGWLGVYCNPFRSKFWRTLVIVAIVVGVWRLIRRVRNKHRLNPATQPLSTESPAVQN
jgi:hypothetical protein